MGPFATVDRGTAHFSPPSMNKRLSSHHLARFVVKVTDRLDLNDLKSFDAWLALDLARGEGADLISVRRNTRALRVA